MRWEHAPRQMGAGTETEYAGAVQYKRNPGLWFPISTSILYEALERAGVDYVGDMNELGRLYVDVGDHPEACTYESPSPAEIAKAECEYDDILMGGLQAGIAEEGGGFSKVELQRRSPDHGRPPEWNGHHVNAEASSDKLDPRLALKDHRAKFCDLGRFLLGIQTVVGAGCVQYVNGKFAFTISQKMLSAREFANQSTMRDRGLVNTRDEPLSGEALTRTTSRIHIIQLDPNMHPLPMQMGPGLSMLEVRALEAGLLLPPSVRIAEVDLVKAAHQIALDVTCSRPLETEDGRTFNVVNLLEELRVLYYELLARDGMSEELYGILEQFDAIVDVLGKDPLSAPGEWQEKYVMLSGVVDRDGRKKDSKGQTGWQHDNVRVGDLLWTSLTPRGIGVRRRQKQWLPYMPRPNTDAMQGRPLVRRKIIKALADRPRETGKGYKKSDDTVSMGWDYVSFAMGRYGARKRLWLQQTGKDYDLDVEDAVAEYREAYDLS